MNTTLNKPDPQFEQTIRSAEKAIKYAHSDPETALLHARKASEAICRDVYETERKVSPKGLPLGKMIEALSRETVVLPKKVMYSLRVIQNFGGANAHENIEECLEPALEFFSIIIHWYFNEFRKTGIPGQINLKRPVDQPFFPTSANPAIPVLRFEITPNLLRAYSLFGYETDGEQQSALWAAPSEFHQIAMEKGASFYEEYQRWLETRRQFVLGEIANNRFVKVAAYGNQFLIQLHEDGTLTERKLFSFDENEHWGGNWRLVDGALRLNIGRYELDIIAGKNGIHSGVEDEDGNRYAYFKVLRLR